MLYMKWADSTGGICRSHQTLTMKNIPVGFLTVFLLTGIGNCQPVEKKTADGFGLNSITFYSSRCKGTCPDITLEIDGFKNFQLIRQIVDNKGLIDTVASGGFKGQLSEGEYKKTVGILAKVDWDHITFPDVQCCDGPVVSIIISYYKNGNKNRRFRSMTPPKEASAVIDYLEEMALKTNLPKYDKPMDFIGYELPEPVKQ